MNFPGRSGPGVRIGLISSLLLVLAPEQPVRAAPPSVSLSPGSVKIQVTASSVAEAIDALSRATGFKVTYEGPRPVGMIFNAEITTPSVAETLFRLLEGQNLNYGVVFDLSGTRVTSLMVLGPASKKAGIAAPASSSSGSRAFAPPRNPRNDLPPVDDDPAEEAEPEAAPAAPEPTPAISPSPSPEGSTANRTVPVPPSPFTPRPLVVSPFAPRPTPSPLP